MDHLVLVLHCPPVGSDVRSVNNSLKQLKAQEMVFLKACIQYSLRTFIIGLIARIRVSSHALGEAVAS